MSIDKSASPDFLAIVRAETTPEDLKKIWAGIVADAKSGDQKCRELVLKMCCPNIDAVSTVDDGKFRKIMFILGEKPEKPNE